MRSIIAIASTNPVKEDAVVKGFKKTFPEDELDFQTIANTSSGVSDQPKTSEEARQGAENRARHAYNCILYCDPSTHVFGIGIEGGIEDGPDGMRSFAWVCVTDGKQRSFAQTGIFYLPLEVAELIRDGMELGHADDKVFSKTNSKQANGAIGILTEGVITRTEYYAHAVIMALIPFRDAHETLTWPSTKPTKESSIDVSPFDGSPFDDSPLTVDDFRNMLGADVQVIPASKKTVTTMDTKPRDPLLDIYEDLAHQEQRKAIDEFMATYAEYKASSYAVSDIMHQPTESERTRHFDAKVSFEKAAMTLGGLMGKGGIMLQGEDPSFVRDTVLQTLRRDTVLQSKMIDIKNDQVVRITGELRTAKQRIEELEAALAEASIAQPQVIDGKRVSNQLTNPGDHQIEEYYQNRWERVFEGFSNGEHFIRFETVIPWPQPEAEEDAAAKAAIKSPVPEMKIVVGHEAVTPSTLDLLAMPGGAEVLKASMHHDAVSAGVQAGVQRLSELGLLVHTDDQTEQGMSLLSATL